jgi:hypothetical protein
LLLADLVTRATAPLPFTLVACALAACATREVSTPRSRVAKDLGCEAEATRVDLIAEIPGEKAARWQVTGCGHTAVYVCTAPVRDCWREGDVQ